jgi:hypothetical protein
MNPFDDFFNEGESKKSKDNWKVVRDLLASLLGPAKDWADADCLGDLNDMAIRFTEAYPDVNCTVEDLRLALHDLNISYERNEHNNKYYYLAKWR